MHRWITLDICAKKIPQSILVVFSLKGRLVQGHGERDLLTLTSKTQQMCPSVWNEHNLSSLMAQKSFYKTHEKIISSIWKSIKICCLFVLRRKGGILALPVISLENIFFFWFMSSEEERPHLCGKPLHHQHQDSKQETDNGTNTYVDKATAAPLSYIWDCMYQSELCNLWQRAEGSSRIQLLRIWRRIFSLFMDHKENACLCWSCKKMTNKRDSRKHIRRSK